MFKSADPTRRMPSWLQNGTKENFVWQIATATVIIVAFIAKDEYDEWKANKDREQKNLSA